MLLPSSHVQISPAHLSSEIFQDFYRIKLLSSQCLPTLSTASHTSPTQRFILFILWQPPPPLTSRSPSWAMALKLRITPMMVMRFSTLSAPKEKEEHERRECGKMAMVLLLQTQPRPHISNNPLWSTVLFPQFLLPLGDVLTCQLGHQRSHQVRLVEVGSDLNKYIHVFYHQLLQSEQRH